jgi:hypothetical protein
MLSHEEAKILRYLRRRIVANMEEICQACLPGATPAWANRVLADLEWLGYVVVLCDGTGRPTAIETTERGRTCPVQ